MDVETGGLVTMSYQPLTEMKPPTFDEMEMKVEQVIAKIAEVTKQHKADVQVCVDCADGLLEVAQDGGTVGMHEKATSMHFALQDTLKRSSLVEGLDEINGISAQLKCSLLDMQLMCHGVTPCGEQAVCEPRDSSANKRRLAFEMEKKVELLTRKMQSKTQECEELRKSNDKILAELHGNITHEDTSSFAEMKEVKQTLQIFKAVLEKTSSCKGSSTAVMYGTLEKSSHAMMEKLKGRLTDLQIICRRRMILLEAYEKEARDNKERCENLQAELTATRRLQEEMEKATKLPRFAAVQQQAELQEQITDLEDELSQWQQDYDESQASLSDQVSENEALRKQLSAQEDKQQQILAQFDAIDELQVVSMRQELEKALSENEKLRSEVAKGESAKAEMQEALMEIKEDLGDLEFRKLEEEVDAEMEIDGLSPPEWITERISAGELLDVDAGRLARRLTAMIRHSVTAERPVAEDTEAVITEFVDKACEWQAAVQNLKHQLEDQAAETEAWKQKAEALQATQAQHQQCAVHEQSTTCEVGCCTETAGSVVPPDMHLAGDPGVNLLRFEMEISRLHTRIAGLESESSSKAFRVTQLEEELGSMLTELENSEVKQVELEAQLEVLQNAVDKQWEATRERVLRDLMSSHPKSSSSSSQFADPGTPSRLDVNANWPRALTSGRSRTAGTAAAAARYGSPPGGSSTGTPTSAAASTQATMTSHLLAAAAMEDLEPGRYIWEELTERRGDCSPCPAQPSF